MGDVTHILRAVQEGNTEATNELIQAVYQELRFLAVQMLSQEKPGQTLQATALVHEAYLRLVKSGNHRWDGRGHFFAAAAKAMRRLLIEDARRKNRSPQYLSITTGIVPPVQGRSIDLIALDEALTKLDEIDPIVAKLIELHYFGGFTLKEAAEVLEISPRTADRYWAFGRAWLHGEITKNDTACNE